VIEGMTMIENYYTPEQLEMLRQRREEAAAAGVDIAKKGQQDWADLISDLTAEMNKGTDPADPKMKQYAERRQALVSAFTGGDPGIAQSLKRLWTEQGDKLASQFGYDPKLMEYLAKVAAAHPELKD
jgi:glycogen synthase